MALRWAEHHVHGQVNMIITGPRIATYKYDHMPTRGGSCSVKVDFMEAGLENICFAKQKNREFSCHATGEESEKPESGMPRVVKWPGNPPQDGETG